MASAALSRRVGTVTRLPAALRYEDRRPEEILGGVEHEQVRAERSAHSAPAATASLSAGHSAQGAGYVVHGLGLDDVGAVTIRIRLELRFT
jgi:hypothetical protein